MIEVLKVLLVNPPQTRLKTSKFYTTRALTTYFPLGLIQLAAAVRTVCNVRIFDCLLSNRQTVKGNTVTYGASPKEIKAEIEQFNPEIVGVSVPFTTQYCNALLVAMIAKTVNPKVTTVFGGPDPTVRFKAILESFYCDYCVVGEGEETFREFIKQFPHIENVKGLAYKRDGKIYFAPRSFLDDLDVLPFPALDLVDAKQYLKDTRPFRHESFCKNSITVMTSRGCPFNCVFCSVHLHMGRKYRVHSPDYVLRLLRWYRDKYGIRFFHFIDDNLSLNQQRFEAILDRIIEEGLDIEWDTPNGVRADSLSYGLLKKMKDSGCVRVSLALESGVQRVLDEVIGKKASLKRMLKVVRHCKELGLPASGFYVIGFPEETVGEMKETVRLAIKLYRRYDLVPGLNFAMPLYGTELYEKCVRNNYIEENFDCGLAQLHGKPMISTPNFSPTDVQAIINEFVRECRQVKKRFLLRHPKKLTEWLGMRLGFWRF